MSAASKDNLALVVPGETSYLCLIRDFVTAVARRAGFSEQRVGEIEIAVDEACANIVEHAYGGTAASRQLTLSSCPGSDAPAIVLRIAAFGDRLEVKILDRGPRYVPEMPNCDDPAMLMTGNRKRGIGTYIIRNVMDEVRHEYRPGNGNELTLVKYNNI